MSYYTYTWKGAKKGLLNLNVSGMFDIDSNESKDYMEEFIPRANADLYSSEKDISYTNDFIRYSRFWITRPNELNKEGCYALYKNKVKLYNEVKLKNKSCYINEVYTPGDWQSRIVILQCLAKWRSILRDYDRDYLEYTKFTYLDLERNKWGHKNYLKRLKVLPYIYDWQKVITLFQEDKYKPIWYKKEIDLYNKLIGE